MATKLDDIRKQYPAYDSMSDAELAYRLYKKFYSDKPLVGYAKDIGFDKSQSLDFLKFAADAGDTISYEAEAQPTVGGDVGGVARGAFQGLTLGFGDEIVAGGAALGRKMLQSDNRAMGDIYQQELERERARIGEFRETDPTKAIASEIAGGIAVPFGATKTIGGAALTGAGMGAVAAAGTSEGDLMDRVAAMPVGAALGGVLGGAFGAIGKGAEEAIKGRLTKKAAEEIASGAKSASQIKAEAQQAYRAAGSSGVQITPQAFERLVDDVLNAASGGRKIEKALTPQSASIIKRMQKELQGLMKAENKGKNAFIGIDDLDNFYKMAQTPMQNFANPSEQRMAGIIQREVQGFLETLDASDLRAGDASKVVKELTKARSLWQRMRKTERIEELIGNASTYAGGIESGLRNQISVLLRNPKKQRGFTEAELELLRQIRDGTPVGNLIGNVVAHGWSMTGGRSSFGQGAGSPLGLVAGAAGFDVAGPMGAAAFNLLEQAGSTGVKRIREMSLENRVRLFRDIVASGQAERVRTVNPSVFRILEAAFQNSIRGATGGVIAGTDQNLDTMMR